MAGYIDQREGTLARQAPDLLGHQTANEECQSNRVQCGNSQKTDASQCEHLRHGSPPTLASLAEALTPNYFLMRGGCVPEARMNIPLESKSDSPERFDPKALPSRCASQPVERLLIWHVVAKAPVRLTPFDTEPSPSWVHNEHVNGGGPRFREHACKLGLEGVISKRVVAAYSPRASNSWGL